MNLNKIIDLMDSTEIAFKPNLDDPNEYLAIQAAYFAVYTAKLIKEVEKGSLKQATEEKVKEAFLVVEYLHTEANPSTERKFEKIYFYCLQAQVNLKVHRWVLNQMSPEMKDRYEEMFNF